MPPSDLNQSTGHVSGTASYYKRLGLIDDSVDITDEETDINILFEMALQRLVFMPFGYLVTIVLNALNVEPFIRLSYINVNL